MHYVKLVICIALCVLINVCGLLISGRILRRGEDKYSSVARLIAALRDREGDDLSEKEI